METNNAVKEVKSINENLGILKSIFLLNDGRLITTFEKYTIKIYDPNKDFECVQTINLSSIGPIFICQLDNGDLALNYLYYFAISSLTPDGLKKEIEIKKPHGGGYSSVSTLCALSDNRLASCGSDKKLKIWDMNKPYQEKKLFEGRLKIKDDQIYCNYYDREREILLISTFESDVRVFDVKNYKQLNCVEMGEFMHMMSSYSMMSLDKNRILIGGVFQVAIIDLETFEPSNVVFDPQMGCPVALIKLKDNFVLLENSEKKMYLVDITKKTYTEITCEINEMIKVFIRVNDDTFISGECDGTIRVWKDEMFLSQ